jgi:DNA polymerase V
VFLKTGAEGVSLPEEAGHIRAALQNVAVNVLWGVGHRYASLLKRNGKRTAWELSQAYEPWIEKHMTVSGLRLVHELQCHLMKLKPPRKKPFALRQVLVDRFAGSIRSGWH